MEVERRIQNFFLAQYCEEVKYGECKKLFVVMTGRYVQENISLN